MEIDIILEDYENDRNWLLDEREELLSELAESKNKNFE